MKKLFALLCLAILAGSAYTQAPVAYPSNWWVGMKMNKIQLMVYGKDISRATRTGISHPGIRLHQVNRVENPNYLFVDISILPSAKPGKANILFQLPDGGSATAAFEIKARRAGNGRSYAQGVTSSDFIYLLMPDRFSNGDPSNDRLPGMRDQTLNRDSMYHRHGGDLQGVINNIPYLKDLGVTAVWMTPVIENDMPERTEHGYAFTNHYKIEPRFGGAEMYKKLSDELHRHGMKLVQDAVYNHVGSYHFTVLDPPMKDWLHQWPSFTQTTYKDQPLYDPYASAADKKKMLDGWFTTHMPDMNQDNPYVANYMIQHAIWSVEEFGVDGWRIDTYPYNDLVFMNRCNQALLNEYPRMTMFGETWVHGIPSQAYFTRNKVNTRFKSNLPGVTDFQTNMYGIIPALTEKFGWTDGVNKLYSTLAGDYVYEQPMNNVIFLDNHDKSRIFSMVNENVDKQKMAIGWLLTARGIPQMYYGTEVLMKGHSNPDGWLRMDFPGGWNGDRKSAIDKTGLTADEASVQSWTRTIANFRKASAAIKNGSLMQYVPDDGLYVYFRYSGGQSVMCVMHTGEKEKTVDPAKYAERTSGFSQMRNIVSGTTMKAAPFTIRPWEMLIFELQK